MATVTRTIPNLANGMSLQPPILRSIDQSEAEVNTWGIISVGLGRRPPTQHIADLGIAGSEDAFLHTVQRDRQTSYLVVIDAGQIRVFDNDTGVEQTVTAPFGWGYLTGAAKSQLRATTVADYTFIVNTNKVVAMGAYGADQVAPPAYVYPGGSIPAGIAASL